MGESVKTESIVDMEALKAAKEEFEHTGDISHVVEYIRSEMPLTAVEMGGIYLKMGITSRSNRKAKDIIKKMLEGECYVIEGRDDCLGESYDAKIYYVDKAQFFLYHNELF
ncbi:MAG: hypothetical protein ABIA12_00015 [Candidatus Aenigmatarchaeota archaeon]